MEIATPSNLQNAAGQPKGIPKPETPTAPTVQIGDTQVSGAGSVIGNNPSGSTHKAGNTTVTGQGAVAYKPPESPQTPAKPPQTAAQSQQTGTGNDLAWTREYVANRGYGDIVNWNAETGMANIAGRDYKPVTLTDGKSYLPTNVLDNAIAEYEKINDVRKNRDAVEYYDENYGSRVGSALDKLIGRQGFDYDPNDDIVYQAYSDMYKRNADEAYKNQIQEINNGAGGNLGAISLAMQNRDNYLKELNDIIPTTAADAFNRYESETGRLRDNLADMQGVANDAYSRMYQYGRDQIGDLRTSQQDQRTELQREFENQNTAEQLKRALQEQDYQNAILKSTADYAPKNAYSDYASKVLANINADQENHYNAMRYPLELSSSDMDLITKRGYATSFDEPYNEWLKDLIAEEGKGFAGSRYTYNPYVSESLYNYYTGGASGKATQDVQNGVYSLPQWSDAAQAAVEKEMNE